MAKSKLDSVFSTMKARCYKKESQRYEYYGARGIKICDEWMASKSSFFKWAKENGYQEGLEIDREDNNKGYSPENCRWVEKKVNARNRRSTVMTMERAKDIHRLLKQGCSRTGIALLFKLKRSMIDDLAIGRSWKESKQLAGVI